MPTLDYWRNAGWEIEARVMAMVSEHCGVDISELNPGTSPVRDLGLDSLDAVELVVSFEEEFGVDIADERAETMLTIRDIATTIEEILRKGPPVRKRESAVNKSSDESVPHVAFTQWSGRLKCMLRRFIRPWVRPEKVSTNIDE